MKTKTFDLDAWTKKRETTYRTFCLVVIFLGAEYSMIIPSLWFYLHDVIKTNHERLFYDLSLSIYYVASIVASVTVTLYVDRTRNLKQVMLVFVMLEVFGSLLYAMYFSVYFPLIARVIQGLGDVNISLITAEVVRVYPKEQCTQKISNIVACFSASFILSPGLNIIFKYINIDVYGFKINYGNFPGILMAILFVLIEILIAKTVCNLSKEYDMKAATIETADTEENCKEEIKYPDFKPKHLFYEIDFLLLTSLGFIMTYSVVAFLDISFPIMSSLYFHQSSQFVGAMFVAAGSIFMVLLQVIKIVSKKLPELYIMITGLCVFILSTVLLFCVSFTKRFDQKWSFGFLIASILLLGTCWCVEQVFVRSMLAKLIPSNVQAFGEGVRRGVSSTACIISSLVTGFFVEYIYFQCLVTVLVTIVAIICLLCRKETLIELRSFSNQKRLGTYTQVPNKGTERQPTYTCENGKREKGT